MPVQSIYENDRVYEVVDDRLQALTVERVGDHATDAGEYRILVRGDGLHAGRIITTQLPKAISGCGYNRLVEVGEVYSPRPQWRFMTMRIMKLLPIAILTFAASLATADDKDCSDIDNDRARQECRQHKSDDVDCSKLNSDMPARSAANGSTAVAGMSTAASRSTTSCDGMSSGKVGLSSSRLGR